MYLVYLPDVGGPSEPLIQKHVGRGSSSGVAGVCTFEGCQFVERRFSVIVDHDARQDSPPVRPDKRESRASKTVT